MNLRNRISKRLLQLLCCSVFVFIACHLSQDEKVENTLSFTSQFDSLSKYDTVQIELKDLSGNSLGIIYRGHVDTLAEIEKLSTPDWSGGKVVIVISGFNKGSTDAVFKVEKRFDGKSNSIDTSIVLIHPNPGMAADSLRVQLVEGQTVSLPKVKVTPYDLMDRSIRWSTSNPDVITVQDGALKAGTRGLATLTAKLNFDSTRTLKFDIVVQADPRIPESLVLDRDTLYLAENGAPGQFSIQINPATASTDVLWRLEDSSKVALTSSGGFQGLLKGLTKVWASSRLKASIMDSGYILVSEPVLVEKVSFLKESTELFVGGATEVLGVEVMPLKANQEVEFTVVDPGKATLDGNKLTPVSEGQTQVIVKSKENPAKADTLAVKISAPIKVERVEASLATLTLYKGGPGQLVTAKVYPAEAPPQVQWISLSPTVATVSAQGDIKPLTGGFANIVATSQADSLKKDTVLVSVKVDAPQLYAGKDTTISVGQSVSFLPTAPQEYGTITRFKWDLDGNQEWDDSSASIQSVSFKYDVAKEYIPRFFVRDTEGNEVIVTRRIMVVGGAVVAITSPANNSYTNQKSIKVEWSINGRSQDSLTSQELVLGPNVISRTARDSAGKVFKATVTVYLDTTAPLMPKLYGTSPTNVKPVWIWSSGGGEGSGNYRFRLVDGNFPSTAPAARDTIYTLAADPTSGVAYILFVQERDAAGNWSPSASLAIIFDITKPVVVITAPQASGTYFTALATVSLSGKASGPLPVTKVTYKVGTGTALTATLTGSDWSTPGLTLQEGIATLVTVTATDNANNTGETVLTLFHDNTTPSAPTIGVSPPANIGELKGTWSWNAGSDGTGGSGLNGKYRYSLNSGAWKDTSVTLLSDLPLAEGNNVFAVQEQDKAGLWSSSATSVVKADVAGPVITVTSHTSPLSFASTSLTLSGEVKDVLTSVTSMSVSGQTAGSGTVTITGVTWTTASLTLKSGVNTLSLLATDLVGNTRTLTFTVNVNIPAPKVIVTSPSDNTTLTNKDTIRVIYTLDGVSQNQVFNLNEGTNNLIVASPANESGNIGRDTVSVRRDMTAPFAPTLTVDAAAHKTTATWRWSSVGDNSGGAGLRSPAVYQYSTNGGSTWTTTSEVFLTTTPAEGVYSLIVQQQDRAGNWSPSSTSRTITIDNTAPIVNITSPLTGFVTNLDAVLVSYTEKDGSNPTIPKSVNYPLSNADGSNTVTITSEADAAGNTSTASVTVWRRSNVLFVRKGGGGDGSSWASAFGKLEDALAAAASGTRKHIWMGTGTYQTPGTRGFVLTSNVVIYGGFTTADIPTSPIQRDSVAPYSTILSASSQADTIAYWYSPDFAVNPVANVGLNSLQIEGFGQTAIYGENGKDFKFANLDIQKFHGESVTYLTGSGTMTRCNFHHNSTEGIVLKVQPYNWDGGTGLHMFDCTFSDNTAGGYIVYLFNGTLIMTRCSFLDYGTGTWQLGSNAPFPEAIVTYLSCTVRGGRDAMFHPGTLNYDNSNTTIP